MSHPAGKQPAVCRFVAERKYGLLCPAHSSAARSCAPATAAPAPAPARRSARQAPRPSLPRRRRLHPQPRPAAACAAPGPPRPPRPQPWPSPPQAAGRRGPTCPMVRRSRSRCGCWPGRGTSRDPPAAIPPRPPAGRATAAGPAQARHSRGRTPSSRCSAETWLARVECMPRRHDFQSLQHKPPSRKQQLPPTTGSHPIPAHERKAEADSAHAREHCEAVA